MAARDVILKQAVRRRRRSRLFLPALAAFVIASAALCAVAAPASAAPGEAIWGARYSSSPLGDGFMSIARGPNHAVYVTGYTKATEESSRLVLVKYTDNGTTVTRRWAAQYRWPGVYGSDGTHVAVDPSGNVIVVGTIGLSPVSSNVGRDIVILKYSAAGTLRWATRYNGTANRDDEPAGLAIDADGNIHVSGTCRSSGTGRDYVVLKIRTTDGAKLWTVRYNTAGTDEAGGVAVDAGGNTYVTGTSRVSGVRAAATLKISPSGTKLWTKRFEAGVGDTYGRAIAVPSATGGVYIGGNASGGMSTRQNMVVARLARTNGATTWTAMADSNTGGTDEYCLDFAIDSDGSTAWAGLANDPLGGASHGLMGRVDPAGSVSWTRELIVDGPATETNFQAVAMNPSGVYAGGYAALAVPGLDFVTQHISNDNVYQWTFFYNGNASATDICRDVTLTTGALYAAGLVETTTGGTDAYLVKIDR